ncbi:nucleoside triphosphate pyrophosphohydrolase [Candidatus Gracilibacteria bacterium]|nr:nucleoside triphosphate pyrophosphohydrolase [Candidatus Gracilibacteria bacterium]
MEKLIRDKVPDIPHPDYPNMTTRLVRDIHEHVDFLLQKKDEELREFDNAVGDNKIGEAADILEVYDTLIKLSAGDPRRQVFIEECHRFIENCRERNLSLVDILQKQIEKKEERGGFENGTIWIYE